MNKENTTKEAKNNLVGFFDLLLKIDMRVNPQIYKPKKEKDLLRIVRINTEYNI